MLGLLVLCLSLGLDVLTVDDNGPADFPDIVSAVAASQPGDVILVAGGIYAGFDVTHELAIVATDPDDLPRVSSLTRVDGVAGVTLDGLELVSLEATDAVALVVRGGSIGDWLDPGLEGALAITTCSGVLLSEVDVRGSTANDWDPAPPSMVVTASEVALNGCFVTGADGFTSPDLYDHGGDGGIGLEIEENSHVWIVATSVYGGDAGWGTTPFSPNDGTAGTGIQISDSTLVAYGSATNVISTGGWDPTFSGEPGHSLVVIASKVRASGVTIGDELGPTLSGGSKLVVPAVPDPYLRSSKGAPWATDGTLHVFGPAGMTFLVGIGTVEKPIVLPHGSAALWWQPQAIDTLLLPVTTSGSDTPVAVHVPAHWLGDAGTARAAQLILPAASFSKAFVSGPDVLIASP